MSPLKEWIKVEPKPGHSDAYVNPKAIVRIDITMYNQRARLSLMDGSVEFASPDDVRWLMEAEVEPLVLTVNRIV